MLTMETRFDSLPSRLREVSTEVVIGDVPCLLVRGSEKPRPFLFWMHGRTADKELDPGRYLRYVRRGINVCAVDLPGHGARYIESMQEASRSLEVILMMTAEMDGVLEGLEQYNGFDLSNAAIGGMSAGGIAAIERLCKPHLFKVAVLEATSGDFWPMRDAPLCKGLSDEAFRKSNPIEKLDGWKSIPIIAFHSRHDQWIPFKAQESFMRALKARSEHPQDIEFVTFDRTGAPNEHIGFGRESAFVKEVQVEFVAKHLNMNMETT